MSTLISPLKLGRFLAAGLPAALVAMHLNYALVELARWPKPAAYALALVMQVTINFFACRYFVFARTASASAHVQFAQFASGILGFRVLDWIIYAALVSFLGPYYLALQGFNLVLFALLKFRVTERVMEGR